MSKTVLWVACAAVLLAFLAGRRSTSDPAAVRALQGRVDSLIRSRPAFQQAQTRVDTVVVRERASATASIRRADSLKKLADSLHTALAYSKNRVDSLISPTEAPPRHGGASDTSGATGAHPTEADALRWALAAEERATAALTVALDTMTAARDRALSRLAVAEGVAHQGLTVAQGLTTWRLGPLRLPKVPKWVAAAIGCSGGAYLDRSEPLRGCGLGGVAMVLVVPTR